MGASTLIGMGCILASMATALVLIYLQVLYLLTGSRCSNERNSALSRSLDPGDPSRPFSNIRRDAVLTIIVPPKGSITIQDIAIRNLTDTELEFWVRINEKLKELAVSKMR